MASSSDTDWWAAINGDESAPQTPEERLREDLRSAVPELQDTVQNFNFEAAQVSELCKMHVDWLAGTAMPAVYEFGFPPVLKAAWQLLTQLAVKFKDFSQVALGIPRGHGKTTLVKLFILWCILFTQKRFILVISSTEKHAINIVTDVCKMLDEPNIVKLFGNWTVGREIGQQALKKFAFRHRTVILMGIGAEGSIRGVNLENDRPDVMIFEDIQTKECSQSDVMSNSLIDWMVGTAMKAKSPRGCLYIFCGNMYPGKNSILKKLKGMKSWIKFISGAILADGTALWPELRSLESLIDEFNNDIEMGKPEIFFAEVLNDTEAGINTRCDLTLIKQWPYTPEDQPQGKFIIIDPAKGIAGGDDVAIGYFEVFDGLPALVEVIEETLSPGNTIKKALLLALQHNCKVIAVEGTAYQATLLYWFSVVTEQLQLTGFHFVEVYTGNNSKNSRIATTLKSLTANEILLHPSVRSIAIRQISNWNPLRRNNVDGILDLLTYSPKVLELYGHLVATETDPEHMEASEASVEEHTHMF